MRILLLRYLMPPLAATIVARRAVNLMRDWIAQLKPEAAKRTKPRQPAAQARVTPSHACAAGRR
ncbi:MAG: hypothetical protein ACYC3I_05905 [Gemmataceae bacterium]